MARRIGSNEKLSSNNPRFKKTSIGRSAANTRPRSKDQKRSFKKYRGQGK